MSGPKGCRISLEFVSTALRCVNLYFVREVHVERWKHLNHYITINIYMEILRLFSSLHCLFFYIDPEMGGGGRLGERFKMSAHSPF